MTETAAQRFGRGAETLAARFLELCGFTPLAARFRCREGELDLVMRRGRLLAFVEVKARRHDLCGRPEEAVTPRKLRRMRLAAQRYLQGQPQPPGTVYRFDLVAVDWRGEGRGCRLRHLAGIG
jgi:putative endonuclease